MSHRRINVPDSELEFTFARSSGPGGQNVNKVNSKAILHWKVADSAALTPEMLLRFMERFGSRVNQDGVLVLSSDVHRDQARNREECIQKLDEMIFWAAHPPKKRKKTKPTRSSRKKRLESKSKHSAKKSLRREKF